MGSELHISHRESKNSIAGGIFYCGLLLAATFLIYANSLSGDFVYDDRIEILNNATIRSTANLGRVFREPFWSFAQSGLEENISNYYRPLKSAAYILGIRVWGFDPFWFHILTVGLHALAGILVFFLAARFIKDRKYAAVAAFIFIAHPAQTEAVAWISSLSSTLFVTFYILALYLYLFREKLSRPGLGLALSGLCFLAALLSKETALSFPAVILLSQVFFRSPEKWREKITHLGFFIIVLAVYMFMRFSALSGFSPTLQLENLSEIQIWASVVHLFAKYFGLLLYPAGLSAHHVFYPVLHLADWRFIISVLVLLAFLAAALMLFRKRSIFFFYLAWIPFTLFPMFHIRAIGENVFCDRYLYLPMIGFALLLSHGLKSLSGEIKTGIPRALSALFLMSVLAGYSALTINRNPVWKNNLVFFRETLKTASLVRWINRDFCTAFYNVGRLSDSLRCFENYAVRYPGDTEINFNLGGIYATQASQKLAQGNLDEAEELFDRAEDKISKSFQNTRRDADLFFNLARIQIERSRIFMLRSEFIRAEQATRSGILFLEQSKKRDPEYYQAYLALGNVFLARAQEINRTKSQADPDEMQELTQEAGNIAGAAVKEFKGVIKLFPRNAHALNMLGLAYREAGEFNKAEKAFLQALDLKENDDDILLNLGLLYLEGLNQPDRALDTFIQILEINPNDARAQFYLRRIGAVSLPR